MNGGMIIQDIGCPRCLVRRTVRLGLSTTSFCFNCRFRWRRYTRPSEH